MTKWFKIICIILLVVISIKFFDANFLNKSLVNYIQYLNLIIVVSISIPYVLPKSRGFIFPVQLILISFLISIVMAYQYWDQSFKDSLIATAPYFIFMFFFFLLRVRFSVELLEKSIICCGMLYVFLNAFQFMNSPTVLFGHSLWGDEFTQDRGVTRIIFPGGSILVLSAFIAVNKLTSQKKHLWFWGLMTFLGLSLPILQVTRQFIVGILLIYMFHLTRTLSATKKIVLFSSAVLVLFSLFFIEHPIIEGLIASTENDLASGGDYIRVLAGEYFLFDFSPSTAAYIFGNGVPYTGVSNYGLYTDSLNLNHDFFLSDVGIIAVYAMFGIPAIIAYILIWVKSFTIPLPKEYQYLKYYLWFILLTSFTWYSTYHYHYLIVTVIVLYMYQSLYDSQKKQFAQE